jgi:hypothetical protein
MTTDDEDAKRDFALDLLEKTRSSLISAARTEAHAIYVTNGRVTSVEVMAAMKAAGHGAAMANVDPRWMGAVFRKGEGWVRVGWEQTGSHSRPVAIWSRA